MDSLSKSITWIVVFALIGLMQANASDTGLKSPAGDTAFTGGFTAPTSAYSSNNLYASEATDWDSHLYHDFTFGVPAGATIDGVEVDIEGFMDNSFPVNGESLVLSANISVDGGTTYSADKDITFFFGGGDSTEVYGGATDKWGLTLSDTGFSNANFRVRLTVSGVDANDIMYIDHVQVKVYYTGGTLPPVINISVNNTSPKLNSMLNISAKVYALSGTLSKCWLYNDYNNTNSTPVSPAGNSPNCSFAFKVRQIPDTITFTIYANDSNGMVSQNSTSVTTGPSPLFINFTTVTPRNNSNVYYNYTFINISTNDTATSCNLTWLGQTNWTQGPKYPTGVTQDNGTANNFNITWLNTDFWKVDDNFGSTATGPSYNAATKLLNFTGFNFSIYYRNLIKGVILTTNVYDTQASFNKNVSDNTTRLIVNNAITGNDKANFSHWESGSTDKRSYGSPNDTWGVSLSASDVSNNDSFGIRYAANLITLDAVSGGTANGDWATLTVYFSTVNVTNMTGYNNNTFSYNMTKLNNDRFQYYVTCNSSDGIYYNSSIYNYVNITAGYRPNITSISVNNTSPKLNSVVNISLTAWDYTILDKCWLYDNVTNTNTSTKSFGGASPNCSFAYTISTYPAVYNFTVYVNNSFSGITWNSTVVSTGPSPINISFVLPSPGDGDVVSTNYTFINVTLNESAQRCNITLSGPINSTQTKSPTQVRNDTSTGTQEWRNPAYAQDSDNNNAWCINDTPVACNYLNATGFGFTIPNSSDTVIHGIIASIEKSSNLNGGADYTVDNSTILIKNNAKTGDDKADKTTHWSTSQVVITYGAYNDLWGTTWTAGIINNNRSFGIAFAANITTDSGIIASVDQIFLSVTYTPNNLTGMSGSGTNFYINMTNLENGNYEYNVSCQDYYGTWYNSSTRSLTIDNVARANINITINDSEPRITEYLNVSGVATAISGYTLDRCWMWNNYTAVNTTPTVLSGSQANCNFTFYVNWTDITINFTLFMNQTNGVKAQNSTVVSVARSCTCTNGSDWTLWGPDNCTITTACNLNNKDIFASGNGYALFTGTAAKISCVDSIYKSGAIRIIKNNGAKILKFTETCPIGGGG